MKNGNTQAANYFSQKFDMDIPPYTVMYLKKSHQKRLENTPECKETSREVTRNARKKGKGGKKKYTEEQKRQIVEYSLRHGSKEAAAHFSRVLNISVPVNTVFALTTLYRRSKKIAPRRVFKPRIRYSRAQREAIGRYSVVHGNTKTARYFSKLYGHDVSVQTVASIKYSYKKLHPGNDVEVTNDRNVLAEDTGENGQNAFGVLKKEVVTVPSGNGQNEFDVLKKEGVTMPSENVLNAFDVLKKGVATPSENENGQNASDLKKERVKSSKVSTKPNYKTSTNRKEYQGSKPKRKRNKRYTTEQRNQMAEYSIKYGVSNAAEHFSKLFGYRVPETTITVYKSLFQRTGKTNFETCKRNDHLPIKNGTDA